MWNEGPRGVLVGRCQSGVIVDGGGHGRRRGWWKDKKTKSKGSENMAAYMRMGRERPWRFTCVLRTSPHAREICLRHATRGVCDTAWCYRLTTIAWILACVEYFAQGELATAPLPCHPMRNSPHPSGPKGSSSSADCGSPMCRMSCRRMWQSASDRA